MNDFYTEQLVKKQTSAKDMVIKAFLIAAAIVSVLTVFVFPLGLLIPIIVIALVWFIMTRMDIEYEYLYVNGDLDIDKIVHKSRRKRVFSANAKEIEFLAPVDAPELSQYRSARVIDMSSGSPDARRYALVIACSGGIEKLIFEPNDTIVEGIFMLAPRKVIRK